MSIWFFEEQKHSLTAARIFATICPEVSPTEEKKTLPQCVSSSNLRRPWKAWHCTPAARCAWLIGTAAPQRIISSRLSSTVIPCRPMTRRGTRASIGTICAKRLLGEARMPSGHSRRLACIMTNACLNRAMHPTNLRQQGSLSRRHRQWATTRSSLGGRVAQRRYPSRPAGKIRWRARSS